MSRDSGYRLSRPPERVSVLEVVEAAEGDCDASSARFAGVHAVGRSGVFVHPTWVRRAEALRHALADTLAELVEEDLELERAAGSSLW